MNTKSIKKLKLIKKSSILKLLIKIFNNIKFNSIIFLVQSISISLRILDKNNSINFLIKKVNKINLKLSIILLEKIKI